MRKKVEKVTKALLIVFFCLGIGYVIGIWLAYVKDNCYEDKKVVQEVVIRDPDYQDWEDDWEDVMYTIDELTD